MVLFMALAIMIVKINPLAPTSDPATINTLLSNNKPAKAAAIPDNELRREITTGISPPPIGITNPIPAINVGYRQNGRKANKNVIFSTILKKDIINSIKIATSFDFLSSIKDMKNLYGDGNSAFKAYNIIKENDFKSLLFKDEDALTKKN